MKTGFKLYFSLLLVLSFSLLTVTLGAQEDLWKQLHAEATSLYQFGQYQEALAAAEKAVETAESTYGNRHLHYAKSKAVLAHVYRSLKEYSRALENYRDAFSIFEKAYGPYHPELLATKQYIAESQKALEDEPQRKPSPPPPPPEPVKPPPEPVKPPETKTEPPAPVQKKLVPGTAPPALIGEAPPPVPEKPEDDPGIEKFEFENTKPEKPAEPEEVAKPVAKPAPEKKTPPKPAPPPPPPPEPVKKPVPPKQVEKPRDMEAKKPALGSLEKPVKKAPVTKPQPEPTQSAVGSELDRQQILSLVKEYQIAIQYKDKSLLKKIFPYAYATIVGVDEVYTKRINSRMNSAKKFIDFVTSSREEMDKQFSNVEVRAHDGIATMTADYVFYFKGDEANHGKEIWSLVETDTGWVIVSAIWTEIYPER